MLGGLAERTSAQKKKIDAFEQWSYQAALREQYFSMPPRRSWQTASPSQLAAALPFRSRWSLRILGPLSRSFPTPW